jgi:hypothetical protein
MANNIKTQFSRNVFQHQSHPSNRQRPLGGVRQDKRSEERALPASFQPALSAKQLSALAMNRKLPRSQNRNGVIQKKEKVTFRIQPIAKEILLKKAKEAGIPHSVAGAVIFERAIQQDLDMQYGALLEPVIKKCIAKEIQGMSTRLAWLLVRIAFDVGQIRGLVTNILGRQQGMNQEILTTILKESSKAAKMNITRKTPQLTELMEVLDKWLREKGRG